MTKPWQSKGKTMPNFVFNNDNLEIYF
jgi:hypothetical protein